MNIGTVAEAVTTLYGGDPADFVAVRKELATAARTAGERDAAREIAALRKPGTEGAEGAEGSEGAEGADVAEGGDEGGDETAAE